MAVHQAPPSSSLPLPLSRHSSSKHREAKDLPTQILDHCNVLIDEQLFLQAFAYLANSLTSGTGSDHGALLAPPTYLALAATLTVHPSLTTRTTSTDKHATANDALSYLNLVNNLVGPRNAGLDQAFQFGDPTDLASSRNGRRSTKPRSSDILTENNEAENPFDHMRAPCRRKDALWTNAEDFWAVVGWAFNCSIAHPARWDRWKLWLDFTLDVLSDDLEARLPEATRAYEASGGSTAAVRDSLADSMFARYLAPIGEGRNNKRRLMRAVLADGRKQAMGEFGEVWKGETKGPKVKKEDEPVAKRRKLDLENGEFGDYFDDDSDRDSPGGDSLRRSRSTTARRSRPQSTHPDDSDDELNSPSSAATSSIASFGGPSSLQVRQRLLALLSRFCALNPDAFLDTEDLFDLYTEFLRPLPLPIFAAFVAPSTPWLGPNSQASLNQMLLRPLLAGTAPSYDENALTQSDFEEFYAGYAASKTGAVENARVGLLVEGLLRLLWKESVLEQGPVVGRLRKVVEKGIAERRAKTEMDGRRKHGVRAQEEEDAVAVLEASAERMRVVLDLAEGMP